MRVIVFATTIMHSSAITISFDDGHPLDMRVAELLAKYGFIGTFYIPITNRENRAVLSTSLIRELGQRNEIASHTYDHCYLKGVPPAIACDQIQRGKNALENILGREVNGFCYPGGKFTELHKDMVKAAGFSYARTTENFRMDVGDDPFLMPTTIQFYPHCRTVLIKNMLRHGKFKVRERAFFIGLRHENWMRRICALLSLAMQENLVFNIWCHSWEIDYLGAWASFETLLLQMTELGLGSKVCTNGVLASTIVEN